MKLKLLKTSLWTVRVLLALLVLFWAATLANIMLAYVQGGSRGIRAYLMHVGTPAKDYWPSRDEEIRDTQVAYEVLILYILLTWGTREVHGYLRGVLKQSEGSSHQGKHDPSRVLSASP